MDDEIFALIMLAPLFDSWEAMRMTVSNSTSKIKLKYDNICDMILVEEVSKRDSSKISYSSSALSIESRGKRYT